MRIVYVHANHGGDVRVRKSLQTLTQICDDVHFIGWVRSPELKEDTSIEKVHYHFLTKYVGFGGLKVLAALPSFWSFIRKKIEEIKPDKVVIANEDNAFLEALFRKKNVQYVCDVYDSIADRLDSKSKVVKWLSSQVRDTVMKRFDDIIVTDMVRQQRINISGVRTHIVYNAPFYREWELQKEKKYAKSIYLSGSLGSGRGVEELLQAVEELDGVDVVAAGILYNSQLEEIFKNHKKVRFLGRLTPEQSLEVARECLAIFAYYEPSVEVNIYASPNKLYDSIMLNIPILINSETIVSRFVAEKNLGLVSPYYDVDALKKNISSLVNGDYKMPQLSEEFKREFSWDNAKKVYLSIFNEKSA